MANLTDWIENYRSAQKAAMDAIPADAVARLIDKLRSIFNEDRQLFAFGNGGSAANVSHFITDLGKGSSDKISKANDGRRFRCLSLNDNVSWMTALGNDYAYEDIYVRQLENYARAGDMVLGLSVSGSSPNLVKAFKWAREHGLYTAALVGGKRGSVGAFADELVVIDDTHYGRVEDAPNGDLPHALLCLYGAPDLAAGTTVT